MEGEIPVERPVVKKSKGSCPHCKCEIWFQKINAEELELKYREYVYVMSQSKKIAEDVHNAMFRIEKVFQDVAKEFTQIKLQLQLLEGKEQTR